MGSGIAQVIAQNGFKVLVVDDDAHTQKCMVTICKSLSIISKKRYPGEAKVCLKYKTFLNSIQLE